MNDKFEVKDLTNRPQILEVLLDEKNPVVVVDTHNLFQALYPEGKTNGDPAVWGAILADVVQHVARAHHEALQRFAKEGSGPEPPAEDVVLNRLMQVLVDEVQKPTGSIKGTTVVTAVDPKKRD